MTVEEIVAQFVEGSPHAKPRRVAQRVVSELRDAGLLLEPGTESDMGVLRVLASEAVRHGWEPGGPATLQCWIAAHLLRAGQRERIVDRLRFWVAHLEDQGIVGGEGETAALLRELAGAGEPVVDEQPRCAHVWGIRYGCRPVATRNLSTEAMNRLRAILRCPEDVAPLELHATAVVTERDALAAEVAGLREALNAARDVVYSSETMGSLHNIEADAGMVERYWDQFVTEKLRPSAVDLMKHIRERRLVAHQALSESGAAIAATLATPPSAHAERVARLVAVAGKINGIGLQGPLADELRAVLADWPGP